jgi:hypothetical protein
MENQWHYDLPKSTVPLLFKNNNNQTERVRPKYFEYCLLSTIYTIILINLVNIHTWKWKRYGL